LEKNTNLIKIEMKQHHKQMLVVTLVVLLLLYVDPIYAGPGGTVAKAIFKTWWGKLILFLLAIIFMPLIVYSYTIEFFAVRKTKKQLLEISRINKDFSWLNLDKNVSNIFTRVYNAWSNEDMKEASEYVNHWYWQNQQLVHLDRWKKENLKNICRLESIRKIKPLYIEISDEDNLEGSKVAMSITANIEDYLIDRDTKKVVEGKAGFDNEEKIWIMEYVDGKWLLDDIREGNLSLAFAKTKNIIPEFIANKSTLKKA